jgi:hypothetical protein
LALVQRAKYVAVLPWSAGAKAQVNSVLPVNARNCARCGSVTAVWSIAGVRTGPAPRGRLP